MAEETKRVYRLPPCPGYDVEGTESWLSDLSAEGLFLTEDGFFCGLGSFERRTPRRMRYRLEAAPKQIGTFSANGYQPDADAVALSEAFGWEYVTDRDQFFIYRTADPNARELNTDPQVQALALAAVSRRERSSGLATLVWLLIYPLASIRGNLLLPMLDGGTWYILFSFAMLTWMLARSLTRSLHLRRLRRRLQQQGQLDHRRPWRPRALRHRAVSAVSLLLCLLWIVLSLQLFARRTSDEGYTALQDFPGDPPFATMADLAPGGSYIQQSMGSYTNRVRCWSDPLAPRAIRWTESTDITLPDGRVLSGGYYVDYYETRWIWVAREAVRELSHPSRRQEKFEPIALTLPDADADAVIAYYDSIHFPTLVARRGRTVIRVCFYQTSPSLELSISEWADVVVQSLPRT